MEFHLLSRGHSKTLDDCDILIKSDKFYFDVLVSKKCKKSDIGMQSICAVEFKMYDTRSFYRYLGSSVEGLKIQV